MGREVALDVDHGHVGVVQKSPASEEAPIQHLTDHGRQGTFLELARRVAPS